MKNKIESLFAPLLEKIKDNILRQAVIDVWVEDTANFFSYVVNLQAGSLNQYDIYNQSFMGITSSKDLSVEILLCIKTMLLEYCERIYNAKND